MSLYVEVEASHQGCEVAEAVAGMRVPWEGWACSQRLGLRGSSSVRACSGKRRQRHAVDNNHARVTHRTKQIAGTGALLTTVVDCKAGGACVSRWAAVCSRQRSGGALRQRQRALARQQAASVARNLQHALKGGTQNKHITGTGAHLTSVANSDTGAGRQRRRVMCLRPPLRYHCTVP